MRVCGLDGLAGGPLPSGEARKEMVAVKNLCLCHFPLVAICENNLTFMRSSSQTNAAIKLTLR